MGIKQYFKFIKHADIFGIPVLLMYKNNHFYKTELGGIMTFVYIIICIIAFSLGIGSIIQKESTIKSYSMYDSHLAVNSKDNITHQDIDFKLNINYNDHINKTLTIQQLYQYLDFELLEVKIDIDSQESYKEKSIQFDFCHTLENTYDNQLQKRFNFSNFLCYQQDILQLYGSPTSNQQQYYYLRIGKCTQDSLNKKGLQDLQCHQEQEIDRFIDLSYLTLYTESNYFNENQFNTSEIIDKTTYQYYFNLNSNTSNIYNFNIQKNMVYLYDFWIFMYETYEQEFYTLNYLYQSFGNIKPYNYDMFGIYLQRGYKHDYFYRQINTFSNLLSQIGGLSVFIRSLFALLLLKYQRFRYYTSLFSKIFRYQSDEIKINQEKVDQLFRLQSPRISQKIKKNHSSLLQTDQNQNNIFQKLYQQIQQRVKPQLKQLNYLTYLYRICFYRNRQNFLRQKIVENGLYKIKEYIDVVELIKILRNQKFLSQIILSNEQRIFLKYLYQNLLPMNQKKNKKHQPQMIRKSLINLKDINNNRSIKENHIVNLQLGLKYLIENSRNKINQRILDNLINLEDPNALQIKSQLNQLNQQIESGNVSINQSKEFEFKFLQNEENKLEQSNIISKKQDESIRITTETVQKYSNNQIVQFNQKDINYQPSNNMDQEQNQEMQQFTMDQEQKNTELESARQLEYKIFKYMF